MSVLANAPACKCMYASVTTSECLSVSVFECKCVRLECECVRVKCEYVKVQCEHVQVECECVRVE